MDSLLNFKANNENRVGKLIELVGKRGSGKTILALYLCAIESTRNHKIMFIDGSGSFRPEIIKNAIREHTKISNNHEKFLKNIIYQRIYEINELYNTVKKIKLIDVDTIILDGIIPFFLYNFKENLHLQVRKFIRELAITTLTKNITVLFTSTIIERENVNVCRYEYELFFHDILRYVPYKLLVYTKSDNRYEKNIYIELIYPRISKEINKFKNR
jgi:RecA/RadA recombinase